MPDRQTSRFTTERLAEGVRYVLPRRERTKGVMTFGCVLLLMGLVPTAFAVFWIMGTAGAAMGEHEKGEMFGAIFLTVFALFSLPVLGIGCGLWGLGLYVLFGHAWVEIRDEYLREVHRLGPFRWTRKRRVDGIDTLTVERGVASQVVSQMEKQGDAATQERVNAMRSGDSRTLRVSGPDMKPMSLAMGYPQELVLALAHELSEQLTASDRASLFSDASSRVTVEIEAEPESEESTDQQVEDRKLADDQPLDSAITMERRADGLTLTVPPTGVWKGSGGLFGFGVVWLAFCTLFFGVFVMLMIFGKGETNSDLPGIWGPIFVVLFAMVFVGVGVGLTLAGWHMGKRKAVIDVMGRTLLFTQVAPLKTKQMDWHADDLEDIAMGPSGIESNGRSIMCLVITPKRDKVVKLLTARDEDELEWLAAVLRVGLGIRAIDEGNASVGASDHAIQPADSRIGVDRTGGRLALAVPARGLGKVWPMLLIGGVFAAIGIGVWVGVAWNDLSDGFEVSDLFKVGVFTLWAGIFGGGGAAVGIGGLVMARRRYLIEVDRNSMTVERFGPFGRRRDEWRTDQIVSVTVKASGTQVGNHRYHELRIEPRGGKPCKIGNGRPNHELRWLAAVLINELGLSTQPRDERA